MATRLRLVGELTAALREWLEQTLASGLLDILQRVTRGLAERFVTFRGGVHGAKKWGEWQAGDWDRRATDMSSCIVCAVACRSAIEHAKCKESTTRSGRRPGENRRYWVGARLLHAQSADGSATLTLRPMGIIAWLVFGLIAGAVAKLIMPGNQKGGCLLTSLLGIVGAMVGGWIGTLLGFGKVTDFDVRSMLIAVLGAIIVLLIFRVVSGRR